MKTRKYTENEKMALLREVQELLIGTFMEYPEGVISRHGASKWFVQLASGREAQFNYTTAEHVTDWFTSSGKLI